jgi:cell division protein FtsB
MHTPPVPLDSADAPPVPWRTRALAALRSPLALALFGVLMIGLLAVLYLNEVAGVAAANDRLRALTAEQTRLARQDALLRERLGEYTSPAYIDRQARAMGLAPAPPGSALIIAIQTATGEAPR